MQLVSPVNLLPPSICIVCGTQPDGDFVVDTLQDLKTGVATPLNGRKYVCERCVGEFAKLFGFEQGNKIQQAQVERQLAFDELANVRAVITKALEQIGNFVNSPGVVTADEAPDVVDKTAAGRVEQVQSSYEDVFGAPATPEESPAPAEGVTREVGSETPKRKPGRPKKTESGGTK